MKTHNTHRLLSGATKLKKVFTQKEQLKFFVTMTTPIAKTEHKENHKENYYRKKIKVKGTLMQI